MMTNFNSIILPDLGVDTKEVFVGKIFVEQHQEVAENQVIMEVESDKATLEITSDISGKIELLVSEGTSVKKESELARVHVIQ